MAIKRVLTLENQFEIDKRIFQKPRLDELQGVVDCFSNPEIIETLRNPYFRFLDAAFKDHFWSSLNNQQTGELK